MVKKTSGETLPNTYPAGKVDASQQLSYYANYMLHTNAVPIDTVTPDHSRWPLLLRELPEKDRPQKLYIKGTLPEKDAFSIAVVGTRRPTAYGKSAAYEIAAHLARQGVVIVSGMAVGIDAVAHTACIEQGGVTIAVLGSGLRDDVLYPQIHAELARNIVRAKGCLVSEYPPDEKATKWSFPKRNRIIAGIAKAVIVIEAREKSGALITARLATEYGRDLFALPGSIFQAAAFGPNKLIQAGAIPITNPEDVLPALGVGTHSRPAETETLSEEEHVIVELLDEPQTVDDIIKKCILTRQMVLAVLSKLEIRGVIKDTGEGTYRKN